MEDWRGSRWKVFMALALAAVCQVQAPEAAKKPGGGGGRAENIPVEIAFRNGITDRILGVDVDGTYMGGTYSDGVDGVKAVIDASNGWVQLFTCASANPRSPCLSTGRYQFFDYTDWAGQTGEPNLNEEHVAGANLGVQPRDAGGVWLPGGFRDVMNFAGETRTASMKVNYSVVYADGFVDYTTRFNPEVYPYSNFVLVTYLGGTLDCNGGCASWTVEAFTGTFVPMPADCCSVNELEDVAQLVNKDNTADFGRYHMPFKLTVTVKPR